MKDFDLLLQEEVASYEGEHAELISKAPAFLRLLMGILEDPTLPGRLRPLVMMAIAYFALPTEIIPEDLEGPHGYIDDIFLTAWVADQLRDRMGSNEILQANWDGEGLVFPLIQDILSRERELIGDRRELILWYIGYEYLSI
jgi:uncharacterized membrane protein YkvA (DUF1232 family)